MPLGVRLFSSVTPWIGLFPTFSDCEALSVERAIKD